MKVTTALTGALLITGAACMSSPRPLDAPGEFITNRQPDRVWITRTDGERIIVDAPRVFGDSLLGWTETPAGREVVWLPLDGIQAAEARQFDVLRTVLLAAGIGVAAGLGIAALSAGGPDTRGLPDPIDVIVPVP